MRHQQTPFATLIATSQGVVLRSSYNPSLVAELKSLIPASLRKFDGDSRTWTFATQYATGVAGLCEKYIGIRPVVPTTVAKTTNPIVTRILDVRYIGMPRERDDGSITAFGWCDGGWNVILPESVLRAWFLDDNADKPKATQATTLYGVLGVKRDATTDELKTAYRRAARQWHPDVCSEPDAAEMFRKVRAAWEILGDTTKRAKYNAGLALEASLKQSEKPQRLYTANAWRPPLRCGYIMVEAVEQIGRFNVTKILQWQDIVRADGAVLVTSWPKDAKTFVERWSIA